MKYMKTIFLFFVLFTVVLTACSQQQTTTQTTNTPPSTTPAQPETSPETVRQPESTTPEPSEATQTQTTSAKTVTVVIKGFAFTPADTTISVGDTVSWSNEDSAPHTIESADGTNTLRSDELSKGDTFEFTFTKAGTYTYICGIHTSMKGSITVK